MPGLNVRIERDGFHLNSLDLQTNSQPESRNSVQVNAAFFLREHRRQRNTISFFSRSKRVSNQARIGGADTAKKGPTDPINLSRG